MSNVDEFMPEVESVPETALPEVEVTTDAPADKPAQARAEDGKFKPKEEEAKEPAKEPAKAEQKPEHTVPVRTLVDERKAWQAERRALEERLAKLENPPKAPEPIADEQIKPQLQTALEKLQALESKTQEVEKTAKETSEQTAQQRFLSDLGAAEQAFLQTNPDYFEALEHTRNIAFRQMRAFHPQATEDQIWTSVRQQEIGMAVQLAKAGQNPIATAYELAKAYGYQRKEAPAPAIPLPQVNVPKQLAPDMTLGSGGSNADEDDATSKDPFAEAFNEMFKRKTA